MKELVSILKAKVGRVYFYIFKNYYYRFYLACLFNNRIHGTNSLFELKCR